MSVQLLPFQECYANEAEVKEQTAESSGHFVNISTEESFVCTKPWASEESNTSIPCMKRF